MTTFQLTPESEIESRIVKFQAELEKSGCDGSIITQFTDLFYLTGTSQSGYLFVPRTGEPVLMIRKSHARAMKESPLKRIVELKGLKKIPEILENEGYPHLKTLGFELDVIPYNTVRFYRKIFKGAEIVDVSGAIKEIRLIKSAYEIERLKEACAIIDQVFMEVPEMLRPGMTEVDLASRFEASMRRKGYSGCCRMRAFNQDFFMGVLTSGKSGAVPTYFDGPIGGMGLTPANNPHGAGWKKLEIDESIFIDYACVVNGYTADETRVFVMGNIPDRLAAAHRAALEIQQAIVDLAKPGIECRALHEKALSLAQEMGLEDHFMGMGSDKVKFIGHGVGLELDEFPVFAKGVKKPLEPGMTFALEPKFVFPEGAVGIENTYVVRENGIEVLTLAPQDIVCV